jgi:hypothetical protein
VDVEVVVGYAGRGCACEVERVVLDGREKGVVLEGRGRNRGIGICMHDMVSFSIRSF